MSFGCRLADVSVLLHDDTWVELATNKTVGKFNYLEMITISERSQKWYDFDVNSCSL